VLFANSQPDNSKAAIAIQEPPGNLNRAFGASFLRRKTGNAAHVAAYVTRRAMALIVKAATNELFSVSTSITAEVITIEM